MRRSRDEWTCGKSGVDAEIGNFESTALRDGEGVKGEIEIEGLIFGAEIMRKPPALLIARADEGNGGLRESAGELCDVIEMSLKPFYWNGLAFQSAFAREL